MLHNMKLALDDSSRALLHMSERPHAPVAPLYETSVPSRLVINHPMESIREYEPIDPDTILSRLAASNGGRDMNGSVGLSRSSHDVRQRIRLLDEETSTLDEEYNRYLTTNYRKLMEARSNARVPDKTALSPDP
uniref:Uncharacterized protein n=1 Tax=Ciona savignyi TaxID=51511 RepID=H2YGC8_CIOSA